MTVLSHGGGWEVLGELEYSRWLDGKKEAAILLAASFLLIPKQIWYLHTYYNSDDMGDLIIGNHYQNKNINFYVFFSYVVRR